MADDETILCHRCGVELTPGISNLYAVCIEAVADPFSQRIADARTAGDIRAEIEVLIVDTSEMSQRELMDQVARRITLILCGLCYRQWIENPSG